LTNAPRRIESLEYSGMIPPSTTGFQLNTAADALNASSESPRRHDRASAVPLQPALATTWSKRGWRTSAVASGRPVGLPDSRMALRNRLVEVRPYERNSYEMAAAPAL